MKRIKFTLTAIGVVAGAALTFAFKPANHHGGTLSWFSYDGGAFDAAGYNNPENYLKVSSQPTCKGITHLCAIQAISTAAGVQPKLFVGFGTKVTGKIGVNEQTKVTSSASTTITIDFRPQ